MEKQETVGKLKVADIDKKVVELSKEGNSSEKIGLILRDKYGIPRVKLYGKKIEKILKENNLEANSEFHNIQRKTEKLKKHFERNKHDYSSKKSLIKNTGRVNRLKKMLYPVK
jgi:small subunit ribosomal protein S15